MSKILMTSQILGEPSVFTKDSWNESDHPRAENGQFGSGGGSKASPKGGNGRESALSKREKGGYNRKDSEKLLNELLKKHGTSNGALQKALAYNGFCSEAGAEKLAKQLTGG